MAAIYNDEDVKALVEFSKFIGEKAEFTVSTKDMIKYVSLMQRFQNIVNRMQEDLVTVQYPDDPSKSAGVQNLGGEGSSE